MVVLTAVQRERAIGRLEMNERPVTIAQQYGCHVSTIYCLMSRLKQTGTTAHAPRSGRPPVTTDRDDRVIFRTHRADRFTTVSHTSRVVLGTGEPFVSRRTISRRLKRINFRARRPYRGAILA